MKHGKPHNSKEQEESAVKLMLSDKNIDFAALSVLTNFKVPFSPD